MRKINGLETDDERSERLALQSEQRKQQVAAQDAAIDRMIRRNIQQFGP